MKTVLSIICVLFLPVSAQAADQKQKDYIYNYHWAEQGALGFQECSLSGTDCLTRIQVWTTYVFGVADTLSNRKEIRLPMITADDESKFLVDYSLLCRVVAGGILNYDTSDLGRPASIVIQRILKDKFPYK